MLEATVASVEVFMYKATELSLLLASHAGAPELEECHMKAAMRALLYRGAMFQHEDFDAKMMEVLDKLAELGDDTSEEEDTSGEDDEEEDEEYSEEEDTSEEDEEEESITLSPEEGAWIPECGCEKCASAALATREWDAWEVEDDILRYILRRLK
jgi:hypothetical protein